MRRKRRFNEEKDEADIMITPLADVSFTILITLMVVTPVMLITSKLHVSLPEAATVEPPREENLAVTITSDNRLSINNEIVTREKLGEILTEQISNNPDRLILIRADRSTKVDAVMTIMSLVKEMGAKNVSIATIQR